MNAERHQLRRRMQNGDLIICMICTHYRSPDLAMIADVCGLDAVYLDLEHAPYSLETVADICIGALPVKMPTLVRVPSHQSHHATIVLDNGATGVIVPDVKTAEDARRIAQNCRYKPLGTRGVMGLTAMEGYRPVPMKEWTQRRNEDTVVIIMLESEEAIANADEIAAVEGVDCLLIGSNDLVMNMGIIGELHHPRLIAAYETVAAACKRHNKTFGVGGVRRDPEMFARVYNMGARYFNTGGEISYLIKAAQEDLEEIRSACR